MTKNRSMRIAVLVLALALITCCFVGTTFAKYTSSATGSDTVSVAKWAVSAGKSGAEVSITGADPTVAFDLFETILDTKDGSTEGDVVTGKIAPGTKGAFTVSVVNNSEVNVEYEMTFDFSAFEDLPIVFKVNDAAVAPATGSLDYVGGTTTSDTVEVTWEWVFGDPANNTSDTEIGVDAAGGAYQNLEAKVSLVVNQVD